MGLWTDEDERNSVSPCGEACLSSEATSESCAATPAAGEVDGGVPVEADVGTNDFFTPRTEHLVLGYQLVEWQTLHCHVRDDYGGRQ